jgi:hypothetical protein
MKTSIQRASLTAVDMQNRYSVLAGLFNISIRKRNLMQKPSKFYTVGSIFAPAPAG